MAYLNEVALGFEVALFVLFLALVAATLFVDRREARARRRPAHTHRPRPA